METEEFVEAFGALDVAVFETLVTGWRLADSKQS